jgi:hypothetical protein
MEVTDPVGILCKSSSLSNSSNKKKNVQWAEAVLVRNYDKDDYEYSEDDSKDRQ